MDTKIDSDVASMVFIFMRAAYREFEQLEQDAPSTGIGATLDGEATEPFGMEEYEAYEAKHPLCGIFNDIDEQATVVNFINQLQKLAPEVEAAGFPPLTLPDGEY